MTIEESKTYNGWTNYETWNVNLWLENEEGTYHHMRELADDAWERSDRKPSWGTRKDDAVYILSNALELFVVELNPLGDQASMFSDLLSAALHEVNWREIAVNLLEDHEDEDEDEDE